MSLFFVSFSGFSTVAIMVSAILYITLQLLNCSGPGFECHGLGLSVCGRGLGLVVYGLGLGLCDLVNIPASFWAPISPCSSTLCHLFQTLICVAMVSFSSFSLVLCVTVFHFASFLYSSFQNFFHNCKKNHERSCTVFFTVW